MLLRMRIEPTDYCLDLIITNIIENVIYVLTNSQNLIIFAQLMIQDIPHVLYLDDVRVYSHLIVFCSSFVEYSPTEGQAYLHVGFSVDFLSHFTYHEYRTNNCLQILEQLSLLFTLSGICEVLSKR